MTAATQELTAVRLHAKALALCDAVVAGIGEQQWSLPTPCDEWSVRDLVNHLCSEARWTVPLLAGLTVDEVGDALSGDLLGQDPLGSWNAAVTAALDCSRGPGVEEGIVHLSAGPVPAQEYLRQLTTDYLIHTWDLAVALGADETLDAELVAAVGGWFLSRQADYRSAGVIGPPAPVEHDGDPQIRLLAMSGRAPGPSAALAAVARFVAAFDRQDLDGVMAAMTVDCVFEATSPPDGVRHEGQQEVRRAWADFFSASGAAAFETEEVFACGDRVVVRWLYTWASGPDGHVRGVDVFRVRDGLVAEKLSYVKG